MRQELAIESLLKQAGNKKPLIIAGPCSVETEEQVITTARFLAKDKRVKIFRAGIWKPRTRPGAFQGVGSIGLKWLKTVNEKFSLKVAVEVGNSRHVEECLSNGISVLWIGARTTVNPFAVQEIADSLKGVDVTVMIKNPINPDLELWIGAIERIYEAGIKKLIAIHRGFSTYEVGEFRNKPNWEIPLELKRRIPGIPLICDPSHICGSSKNIMMVAQKAMDLAFDGLMIETHFDPSVALSDAMQQLSHKQFQELLDNLVYRNVISDDPVFLSTLEKLRGIIDSMDANIIDNFRQRMEIVEQIAEYKRQNNITILQPERWNYIVNRALEIGLQYNLSEDFIVDLFKVIHRESIRTQTVVMNSNPELNHKKI